MDIRKELSELAEIIDTYDTLVGYWFDGISASDLSREGEPVFEIADQCRNRSYEIINELRWK